MFKSKLFRLVTDEETKKQSSAKLCEPQKCRWTKYLSVPALIGFMLLLILTNVDFTGNAYATTITTTVSTTTSVTNDSQNLAGILKNNNARWRTNCQGNDCYVRCALGTIDNLYEEIERLVSHCAQVLEVRLEYCKFSAGTITAKFFTGNYSLKSFVIIDCELEGFEADAFQQASVADLTNITLIKTNIKSLSELTFLGLNSLKYFTMINNKILAFNGVGFLEPISDTITEVVVQQLSDNNTKYDPTNWLKSKRDQIQLLNVDLSGNIFDDTLNSVTFANLVQVQRLILSNSFITAIELGTFDKIIKTLLYLDLSNNQLKTLSGDFLATNSVTGFHMELYDNAWNCDCANYELVKFIKKSEIEFKVEPKCSTPDELKDMNIKLITIECDGETTISSTKPTTKTTMSTKTTESTTTDESSNTSNTVKTTSETTPNLSTSTTATTNTIWTTDTITGSTSTAPPTLPYLIKCETGETKNPLAYPALNQYDELFSIEPISPTSVRLIRDNLKNLSLIYHIPKAEYTHVYHIDSSEYIEDLTTNVDYVFCLISYGEAEISPFNCRSQHLINSPKEAWLLQSDTALFISLSVFGVTICVVCGMALIYWILRWRPTWLKGNKRLMKTSSNSIEVFLLPKNEAAQQNIFSELAGTTPVDCLEKDSYDYMQLFKNLELSRHQKTQSFSESEPPLDYAPTILRSRTQSFQYPSTQPTECGADLMQHRSISDEYESMNFYDEIC